MGGQGRRHKEVLDDQEMRGYWKKEEALARTLWRIRI